MHSQQPQQAEAQPEQIAGLVERVAFHNDESGFCVLRVKARGHRELATVVGTLPEVRAGEWLEAQGRWIVNKHMSRTIGWAASRGKMGGWRAATNAN